MFRDSRARRLLSVLLAVGLVASAVPPSVRAGDVGPRRIDDSFSGQSIDPTIWWFNSSQPNAVDQRLARNRLPGTWRL